MVDALPDSVPSSPVEHKESTEKKDRAKRTSQNDRSAASRVDIDFPLNKLHEALGDRWPAYQTIVTDFLTGRSTRQEFETCLEPLISTTRNFIRYHNEILLTLLSNSFREAPPSSLQSLGWSKKRRELGDQRSRGDPAAKRLKSEVMGLTNRERARLKKIPKPDPSYRLRPNSMIETRFAKLPRVPVTQQKINSSQHHIDIVRGFHVPLATESQHLPDPASLKDRILASCLENGLLGGLEDQVPDLLINGLEIHLRNILTLIITKLRKNRTDCVSLLPQTREQPTPSSIPSITNTPPLTNSTSSTRSDPTEPATDSSSITTPTTETILGPEELAFTCSLTPHLFVEASHTVTRMLGTINTDTAGKSLEREWSEYEPTQRVKAAMMLDGLI